MKYFFNISLITLLSLGSCSNENGISLTSKEIKVDFVKTFGSSRNEVGQSIVDTKDGGYAILGYTQSVDGDINTTQTSIQYDFWLLKFNHNDELEWQKVYGGSKDDRAYKIINTNDGGFAITGFSKSDDGDVTNNEGFEDIWVIKTDNNGNIQWKTNTGFLGTDQSFSLIQTSDNGFFIGGILDVTASGGQGNTRTIATQHAGGDYWGIKINDSGSIAWRRYFGGTNTDTCYDVIETEDGYFLVGSSDSTDTDINNNKGSYDFWLVKIDKTGNLLWEKSFGGSEIDEARAITKTSDGNLIIVGDTRSTDKDIVSNNGAADMWILKISPNNGSIIWQKNYGGTSFDVARSIHKTKDNGFLISGSSRSNDNNIVNKGQNDAWIVKLNNNGDLIWQKTIGGSNIDFCYDAIQLNNGSIIATGESSSNDLEITTNKGFSDLLVIKLK